MEFLSWLENSEFCTWIRSSGSIWAYPLVLTAHTLGMGILVGFNWAVDLRLLGVGKRIPIRAMEAFFPVMWVGFWLNLVTGLVLLAADATTKMTSWVFGVKMLFIVLAMLVLWKLRKTVFSNPNSAAQYNVAAGRPRASFTDGAQGAAAVAVLEPADAGEAVNPLSNAKLLAILSLVFWALSITAGRLMAYLGPQTGIK